MSRIGKKPITIPSGVTVEIKDGGDFAYKVVNVKGPKGELTQSVQRGVKISQKDNEISLEADGNSKQARAYFGLYRTLIDNMVQGVVSGYKKELEIVGIGYRAELQGANLVLSLGYSHKINYEPPQTVKISVADQVNITVEGASKQLVGEVAAKIRAFRKPEPYKGKGIRYKGEKIKKKSTKAAGA